VYCAALIPTSVAALAGRPAGVRRPAAVAGLFLGALALIPLGMEVLFIARGVLYGIVDDGPYDTAWGGPSRAGAWTAHFLVGAVFAVLALVALHGIALLHRRFDRAHRARWVLPVTVLACTAGAVFITAWTRQI
jgi:hypothetical protein